MKTFLKIEENKNGEIDFGISNIEGLDYEKQKKIRNTIITATYILEDLWRKKIKEGEKEDMLKYFGMSGEDWIRFEA